MFALSDHKAPTVADVLLTEVFLRFGVPRFIHSDQAPEFMSDLMTELYWPQSDGLVELFNRTLINMLSKFCDERQEDWDQHLPFLLCAYRATVNESTGCSPNLLMLGRETMLPIDLMYPSPQYDSYRCHTDYVAWVKTALEDNFEQARQQLGLAAERQKRYYDVRTKDKIFKPGDFVLRFYLPNLRNKLSSPYIGPYRVMARLGEVTFSVHKIPNSKPFSVHVDQLKLYHTVDPPAIWSTDLHSLQDVTQESGWDGNGERDIVHDCGQDEANEKAVSEIMAQNYPTRTVRRRQLPGHFKDYYMY